MSRIPIATPSCWGYDLQRNLGGSFTAHARSFHATEFVLLSPNGEEFGRLRLYGASEAEFQSENHTVMLEASGRRYRILAARTKKHSIDELPISCKGETYEVWVSFFHNLAIASYRSGERAARLSRRLTGRSYEAVFAINDGCT